MNRQEVINSIIKNISRFRTQIELSNKENLTDINVYAETLLIPLLNTIYGWNLRNTNHYSTKNSPAIDLEDVDAGIAIQVSSTGTSAKIKKTLVKYKVHHGAEKHDIVIILILGKKQRSYKDADLNKHAEEVKGFNIQSSIIDFSGIVDEVQKILSMDRLKEIALLLEEQFSDYAIENRNKILRGQNEIKREKFLTNMVIVTFPEQIFTYEVEIDRQKIISSSWETSWKLKRNSSISKVVERAIKFLPKSELPSYYIKGTTLISFNKLEETNLKDLITVGSKKVISVNDYIKHDISKERDIIGLLNRAMTDDMKNKGIIFKHKMRQFYFAKNEKEARNISYVLENAASRDVVIPMFRDENGIPTCYKHLSFKVNFIKSNDLWFMAIKPTWYHTLDGWKMSYSNSDLVSKQKRLDKNQHVNNAFEFIRYTLNNKIDEEINQSYSNVLNFEAVPPIEIIMQ